MNLTLPFSTSGFQVKEVCTMDTHTWLKSTSVSPQCQKIVDTTLATERVSSSPRDGSTGVESHSQRKERVNLRYDDRQIYAFSSPFRFTSVDGEPQLFIFLVLSVHHAAFSA